MLEFTLIVRKPVVSHAIRVTEENMTAVAERCKGTIKTKNKRLCIQVPVANPQNERQATAYVGDWVLFIDPGWKVYTTKAYSTIFDELEEYPCGDTNTLDGRPCVLGKGHKSPDVVVACRSMTDYKMMTKVVKKTKG